MFMTKGENSYCWRWWILVFVVLLHTTHPLRAASNEPSLSIAPAVALSLPTDPDRHYTIQATATLENPVWYDVTALFGGDGTVQSLFQRTDNATSKFFRVVEHDINAGLVAYYPLDGNANDMSAYENDGIVLGAIPVKDRFDRPFGAYHFNGVDQYILVPNQQQQTLTGGDFTVAYWVSFESQKTISHLLGKSDGPGSTSKWIIRHDKSSATFKLDLASLSEGVGVAAAGPWMFASNVWTHVTYTRTGPDYQTYINGRLVSDVRAAVPAYTSYAALTIGQVEEAGWFNGNLDDIRIYNRALSAMEVKALYNYNPVKLGHGLIAHYDFNGTPGHESVFGQTATPTNIQLVPDRFGRPASAGYFDGTSRLELPTGTQADAINLEFTISVWLQFQGTAGERHIIGRSNGGGSQLKWIWLYRSNPSALSLLINNQPNTEILAARTSWPYSTNSWYHFALTKQGSTYVSYINGLKSALTNGPSVLSSISSPIRLGDIEDSNRFIGKMDDLRIYNRAVSEGEVQAIGELID
jgi:hypothetical protein